MQIFLNHEGLDLFATFTDSSKTCFQKFKSHSLTIMDHKEKMMRIKYAVQSSDKTKSKEIFAMLIQEAHEKL